MDQVTQQNAAMVEETNAAARNMSSEAERLSGIIARFEVSQTGTRATPNGRSIVLEASPVQSHRRSVPIPAIHGNLALQRNPEAMDDSQDWSEF